MENVQWTYKSFNELSLTELYSILQLRSEVFVVEQHCPYLDADDKDQPSFHLCGWLNNKLVAYARILPPGIAFHEASIGRVSTALSFRRHGAGKMLMQRAIEHTIQQFPGAGIQIGAQSYLLRFYSELGFNSTHDEYLEDGIPHTHMIYGK
ncbi:MAG: GNAT family N-acetyltransferase [Bacteroidetes bacterium]|jgi:ElaA protein|nr:GNAT family N-acetyltransferase [Bacteroidota bacterium]